MIAQAAEEAQLMTKPISVPANTLRIITFKDEGTWVAVGIDHFVFAQADTFEELHIRLVETIQFECDSDPNALWHLPGSPKEFKLLWQSAEHDERFEADNCSDEPLTVHLKRAA